MVKAPGPRAHALVPNDDEQITYQRRDWSETDEPLEPKKVVARDR
jgi:hypothetical protein